MQTPLNQRKVSTLAVYFTQDILLYKLQPIHFNKAQQQQLEYHLLLIRPFFVFSGERSIDQDRWEVRGQHKSLHLLWGAKFGADGKMDRWIQWLTAKPSGSLIACLIDRYWVSEETLREGATKKTQQVSSLLSRPHLCGKYSDYSSPYSLFLVTHWVMCFSWSHA